jgi:hypothetical protein
MKRLAVLALLGAALATAAVGWSRTAPSIRILDVRPLTTSDAALRDLLGHHLAVRVQKTDARWRLYVDGQPIEDGTAYMHERVGVDFPPGTAPVPALVLRFTKAG